MPNRKQLPITASSLFDKFNSDRPQTRFELISALEAASFRAYQMAELANKEDVQELSKQLTKYLMRRKKACVLILLDP